MYEVRVQVIRQDEMAGFGYYQRGNSLPRADIRFTGGPIREKDDGSGLDELPVVANFLGFSAGLER